MMDNFDITVFLIFNNTNDAVNKTDVRLWLTTLIS